jgi:hypothetical protein
VKKEDAIRRTSKSLEEGSILPSSARHVNASVLPVSPARDVLETFVHAPVLEILGRHDPVASASIDEVIERDSAFLASDRVGIGSCEGTGVVVGEDRRADDGCGWGRRGSEFEGSDFDLLEDLRAARCCVVEEDIVEFGSDDVPRAVVGIERDKVGICNAR